MTPEQKQERDAVVAWIDSQIDDFLDNHVSDVEPTLEAQAMVLQRIIVARSFRNQIANGDHREGRE